MKIERLEVFVIGDGPEIDPDKGGVEPLACVRVHADGLPDEHVAAVLPLVPAMVRAMIEVQLLCGCRPQDVVQMRPASRRSNGQAISISVAPSGRGAGCEPRPSNMSPRSQRPGRSRKCVPVWRS